MPYRTEHRRHYFSIFGKLAFWRPYFYRQEVGGASPLDQELALGTDCYSDLLRELVEYLGVGSTYAKVADCFARILGLDLSTQAISDLVAEDAGEVEAFYAQHAAPAPASEAALFVVQADGKGVPIVRHNTCRGESAVGQRRQTQPQERGGRHRPVYHCAPPAHPSRGDRRSLFHPERTPGTPLRVRSGPQNKRLWATLAGKDAALAGRCRPNRQTGGTRPSPTGWP